MGRWTSASTTSPTPPPAAPGNYADLPAHIGLVHTWTAPTNTAMHRTNTALGFRVVEHVYEMEAVIA